jgi:hypothetical protein
MNLIATPHLLHLLEYFRPVVTGHVLAQNQHLCLNLQLHGMPDRDSHGVWPISITTFSSSHKTILGQCSDIKELNCMFQSHSFIHILKSNNYTSCCYVYCVLESSNFHICCSLLIPFTFAGKGSITKHVIIEPYSNSGHNQRAKPR